MHQSRVCSLLVLIVSAFTVGCTASPGAATVAVTGVVTHNGTPVAGAIVSFVPSGEGENAVGVTDSAGKYLLTTRKKDDGAVPGQYKVSISKLEGSASSTTGSAAVSIDGEMPADYTGAAPDAPPAKNLLPAKYSNPDTSGFSVTVGNEPSTHNFDLEG